jgi:hypothetical protein
MKTTLLILFFILAGKLNAQLFSWASSAPGMGLKYLQTEIHLDGSITILAEVEGSSQSDVGFYDANGNGDTESFYNADQAIIHFDAEGNFIRALPIYSENSVFGISALPDGKLVLLCYIEGKYTNKLSPTSDYDEESEAETEDEDDEKPLLFGDFPLQNFSKKIDAGYQLIYLDKNGHFVSNHHLPFSKNLELTFGEMKMHPNGNLIVCGFMENELLENVPQTQTRRSGANFIACLSPKGELIWYDIIHSSDETCCSFRMEIAHLSIAPNGTIYFAGSLYGDGIFGLNEVVASKSPYVNKKKSSGEMDAFIASYSSDGKFNWAKTADNYGYAEALCADNEHAYIAITQHLYGEAFGQQVDTTNYKHHHLIKLNAQGNVVKHTSMLPTIQDIFLLPNQQMLIFGYGHYSYSKAIKEAEVFVQFKERDNLFIARITTEFQLSASYSFSLLLGHEYETHLSYSNGRAFLFGELWGGLPLPLSAINKAFKGSAQLYGGAAFVGRIGNY